jgi:hypothetical protein
MLLGGFPSKMFNDKEYVLDLYMENSGIPSD